MPAQTDWPAYLPYPLPTDPADFVADHSALAFQISDVLTTWKKPRMARLLSGHQFLPPSVSSTILWPVEDSPDTQGTDGIGYADGVFTINTAGVYQVNCTLMASMGGGNPATSYTARMSYGVNYVLSATLMSVSTFPITQPPNYHNINLNRCYRFSAGDVFAFIVAHSGAASTNFIYGQGVYSNIDITYIAP